MTGTSALTASAAGALRRTRKNRRVDVTELNRVCLFFCVVLKDAVLSLHGVDRVKVGAAVQNFSSAAPPYGK